MYPLRQTIYVGTPGEPTKDRFGNEIPGPMEWAPANVFGWAVVRTEEQTGDSIMRLIDDLQLIAPVGLLTAENEIRLPDDTTWVVEGNAEDYNANPWFTPGLVIHHCKKVEG